MSTKNTSKVLRLKPSIELLKNLIKAAKGEVKSDMIITNANMVDVILGDIREKVSIAIWSNYIVRVGYFDIDKYRGANTLVIDASNREVVLPGFIEPHIHIESSMLTVTEFSKLALTHGTTTVAADPHEIVNVLGIDGLKLFIEESRYIPLRLFFYVPSCVPPTKSNLGTPGSKVTSEEIEEMLKLDEVIGLGEVMDFLSIINADDDMLKKVVSARSMGKVIDGHAPQLPEDMLIPYLITGIEGDHESVFLDEALSKLRNGMRILIREGSAWRDLEELSKMLTYMKINTRYLTFASDDLDIIEKQIFKGNLQTELLEKAKSILEKEKFIYENILPQERIYLKNIGLKSTEPVFIIKEEKLQNRDELLKEIFSFFGYIIFFTCNQKELRAWSIKKGTTAVEAAAKIHTDIARGFIKAEVISFDVLSKYKRISEIKQRNLVRYEDKDYVVNDADFITFKFNV